MQRDFWGTFTLNHMFHGLGQLDLDCQINLVSVEGTKAVPRFETVFDLNGPNRRRLPFAQLKMLLRLLMSRPFVFICKLCDVWQSFRFAKYP